ncbi:MAG TPA: hypothetical protein VES02_12190 [Dermatophilaceae bacterium]|nr:hypothetical protein [Dermatophilaceae bacterium]
MGPHTREALPTDMVWKTIAQISESSDLMDNTRAQAAAFVTAAWAGLPTAFAGATAWLLHANRLMAATATKNQATAVCRALLAPGVALTHTAFTRLSVDTWPAGGATIVTSRLIRGSAAGP